MNSDGVVNDLNPKSDIFKTNRPSIKQLHERNFPCTDTSLLCKYAIPCVYENQNNLNKVAEKK